MGVFNRKFKFTGMYRISFFSYLIFDSCNKTFALQYSTVFNDIDWGGGCNFSSS